MAPKGRVQRTSGRATKGMDGERGPGAVYLQSASRARARLRASGRDKAEGQGAHVDLGLRSWATQLPWATPADNHGSRRRAAPDRSKGAARGIIRAGAP